MTIPIESQIAEMQQSIRERERYFPRLIEAGKITPDEANTRLAKVRAARATLELVAEHQDEIRQLLKGLRQ
jgi:hypothetical protein